MDTIAKDILAKENKAQNQIDNCDCVTMNRVKRDHLLQDQQIAREQLRQINGGGYRTQPFLSRHEAEKILNTQPPIGRCQKCKDALNYLAHY